MDDEIDATFEMPVEFDISLLIDKEYRHNERKESVFSFDR
jgi:hypothetical protein